MENMGYVISIKSLLLGLRGASAIREGILGI